MAKIELFDAGDDRLRVIYTSEDKVVEVYGWVSALDKHFDPTELDKNGQLDADIVIRPMTLDEVQDYAVKLLSEHPDFPKPKAVEPSKPLYVFEAE